MHRPTFGISYQISWSPKFVRLDHWNMISVPISLEHFLGRLTYVAQALLEARTRCQRSLTPAVNSQLAIKIHLEAGVAGHLTFWQVRP